MTTFIEILKRRSAVMKPIVSGPFRFGEAPEKNNHCCRYIVYNKQKKKHNILPSLIELGKKKLNRLKYLYKKLDAVKLSTAIVGLE